MVETKVEPLESNIIKNEGHANQLHNWLKEDGSDGRLRLLYRGSQDGLSNQTFHSKCDNKGCTLSVIEKSDGYVFGGYSNTPWKSTGSYQVANKAFLFTLSGGDIASPCKMKLKIDNDSREVRCLSRYGPVFGRCNDLQVEGSNVHLNMGVSYESGPSEQLPRINTIKEMEVFQVTGKSSASKRKKQTKRKMAKEKPIKRFSEDVNAAKLTPNRSLSYKPNRRYFSLKGASKMSIILSLLLQVATQKMP